MKSFLFLLALLFFCDIGYSQIDITKDTIEIKSTHTIKRNSINEIINDFVNREDFKNWNNLSKKMMIVSIHKKEQGSIIIRVFPAIRKKSYFENLKNNYKAYINTKDCLIVFYGTIDFFLSPIENHMLLPIFPEIEKVEPYIDESGIEIIVIDNTEIYGAEYFVKNDKIKLNKIRYFGSFE